MTLYTDNTDVDVDDYYDTMSSMDVDVDVMPSRVEMGEFVFEWAAYTGRKECWKFWLFFERYIYM